VDPDCPSSNPLFSNIGLVLNDMGRYQEALESHNKALKIRTQLDDKIGMAKDYSNIGLVLNDMGRYQEALDSHNKALKIDEELNDRARLGGDYSNIGLVLNAQTFFTILVSYFPREARKTH
jgi:tetratricopeptide (TPR) repeat protein